MAVAFDEMTEAGGRVRPVYAGLENWLRELGPRCWSIAAVKPNSCSGASALPSRSMATRIDRAADPIRRAAAILSADEWAKLRLGSNSASRRSTLHQDVYGRREVLKAGIVPEDLVFQNPVFRPEMNGLKVPHDIYVMWPARHRRVDPDTFYVLEDNARTPPGSPTCWRTGDHDAAVPRAVLATPRGRWRIIRRMLATLEVGGAQVRSPTRRWCCDAGIYNSAYTDTRSSRQARHRAGRGRDVVVKGQVAYMRTTEGLKRIDVIYRRIDDDFLDPLSFRPDSRSGSGPEAVYQPAI